MRPQRTLNQFSLVLENHGVIEGRPTRVFDDHTSRLCCALKCVRARCATIVCHLFRHLYGRRYLSNHLARLAIHRAVRQTAIIFIARLHLLLLLFELIKRHLVDFVAACLVNHFNAGDL